MSDKLEDSLKAMRAASLTALSSPLRELNPRVKILATLVFVITVVSLNRYDLWGALPFFAYPIIAFNLMPSAAYSIVRKSFFALPFVFCIGIGNLFFDSSVALGVFSFLTLIVKTLLCVMAVLILSASTSVNAMAGALLSFGVPCTIVLQILLTFRYMSVLISEAVNIKNAYLLRASNKRLIPINDWAKLIGNLLLRSFGRADRIYQAMITRGFDARKINLGKNKSLSWKEVLILIIFCVICLLLRSFDFSATLGGIFLK